MSPRPRTLDPTTRVEELVAPRASVAVVALVVLVGELVAVLMAWGATDLTVGRTDDLVVTVAVACAAMAALGQVARWAGKAPEEGHAWLVAAWVVVVPLTANSVGALPFGPTVHPAAIAEVDRALLSVLLWVLALGLAVLGARLRPRARALPYTLNALIGATGVVAGWWVPDGWFVGPDGVQTRFVVLAGAVVAVALLGLARWVRHWREGIGWSLAWTGTGLLLGALGVGLQLLADLGNERVWVAATALLVSSLVVPGLGALVAGGASAGANTLVRRRLREELATDAAPARDGDDAASRLLDAVDVELRPVGRVVDREAIGSIARASFPGIGVGDDWWRAQAAALGLGGRLEEALALRALDEVDRVDDARWVVVALAAEHVDEGLVASLAARERSGGLVVVLRGNGRTVPRALEALADAGVTCGVVVEGLDPRFLSSFDPEQASLVVVGGALVDGMADDLVRRNVVRGVLRHAAAHGLAVLADGVRDPRDLWLLEELGARYVAGPVLGGAADLPEPSREALDLIEAAGLRGSRGPARR